MKLYTEEQVREAIELAREKYPNNIILTTKGIMHQLTPIELPSEGDIIEASHTEIYQVTFNPFASGALWMRDKIKGGQDDIHR